MIAGLLIDGKACFAQVRLRLSKMSQLLEDDVLACLLMSLAKAMGPERVSLWLEQRSMRQRRTAAASMELRTWSNAAVAGYIGARRAMKADFGCGVLL